jgi:peptide/nickel transport system substrate-binding protein
VKARQALTYMIDRERLAAIGYEQTTVPSRTMFVEYGSMEPFIKAIEDAGKTFPAKPDATKAKSLLEDPSVGYKLGPDGKYRDRDNNALTAVITVNQDIAKDQKATADLVAQLKGQGLDARLEPLSNGEYWGRSIPTGDYDLAYGWLSCGSLAEPYTSMTRYRMDRVPAVGSHSPNFNNTGRWDSQANKDYAAKLDEIEPLKLADPAIPKLVAEAYAYIVEEVPFIPLVQTPRIIPFNTTHWTGWPSATEPEGGIPMHNWGATHQMIHALKKVP